MYRASLAGDQIVSVRTLDSGYSKNDFVFAVTAPGWIVGAVQTSGPIDEQEEGDSSYSLALWRYDPTSELLSLATTYSRAGLDVGTGVSLDTDGNIWVSGYSESPSVSSRAVDLALWKFSPDGSQLLAGPFLRPRYLSDYEGDVFAKLLISQGNAFVSSARLREAGGYDLAMVRFALSSGTVLDESAWRREDLLSAVPASLLRDDAGRVVVAGSVGGRTGHAAVWTYEGTASPSSALEAQAGAANGAVYQGPDLWLAVEGATTPYLAAGLSPMAGGLRDILPPRTALVAAPSFSGENVTYVSSGSLLGFEVSDDKLVLGDEAGVGGAVTFYASDGGSFSQFLSSFQITSEGIHPLAFYSRDAEGNEEPVVMVDVAVDLTSPQVTLHSSGTMYQIIAEDPVAAGVASGVREILYLVDADPETCDEVERDTGALRGTCANPFYAGPFALSPGTHSVAFAAIDNIGNGEDVVFSSFVVVPAATTPLSLTSISPEQGPDTGSLGVTIAGEGFQNGATLKLSRVNSASGTWVSAGALSVPRVRHGAARLADGRVLVAGGQGSSNNILSSAELYAPGTDTWAPVASMSTPRNLHGVVALPNGRALVMGGRSGDTTGHLATAELFDPAAGWTLTGSMAAARAEFAAVLLPNGKVLVAGGFNGSVLSSAELYDPASGIWTSAGTMGTPRLRPKAVLLAGGKVLVAGGVDASLNRLSSAELYDPASGTWSPAGAMSTGRQRFVLAALPGGRAIAAGGDTGFTSATVDIFTPNVGWAPGAPMGTARNSASATTLPDGRLLVAGGIGTPFQHLPTSEIFDPTSDAWTPAPNLPQRRSQHEAVALGSGQVLLAGGAGDVGLVAGSAVFTPASFAVVATSVVVTGPSQATAVLDLTGRPTGLWDVVLNNPDGGVATLPDGFTIFHPVPPAAVADLSFAVVGESSVTLRWTAPESFNGLSGYELRRATFPLTEANFASGGAVASPAPAPAGSTQSAEVSDITEPSFYAAIRAFDSFGSVSPLSNVVGLARSDVVVDGLREAVFHASKPVFLSPASSAAVAGQAFALGLTRLSGLYAPAPSGSFAPPATLSLRYSHAALDASRIEPSTLLIYFSTGGPLQAVSSQTVDLAGRSASSAITSLPSGAVFGLYGLAPAPVVASITPQEGNNAQSLSVAVNGSGFVTGARLELNRSLASGSGFTATGPLALRTDARAVRLGNGKVLIAGGRGSTSNIVFPTAALFDPASGTWSATGSMAEPRYGHTMTLLPSGRVLVAGGSSADCVIGSCSGLSTAELYDPLTGTWSYTGALAQSRLSHTATLLANGKVLVAGGGSSNNGALIRPSAELYDPATGIWTSAGTMPSGAHYAHAAAKLSDGRVVIAGGRNSSADLTSAVDIYDPATGAWSPAAPMSRTRSSYTLDPLPDGRLLAAGGDDGTTLASTEIYDPATGGGVWSAGAPLISARAHHTSARLTDGKVLVIGGGDGAGGLPAPAELFAPGSGAWSTVGSLPSIRHTQTLLADGSVLVAGGLDAGVQPVSSLYRPASLSIVASNPTYGGGGSIGGTLDLVSQPLGAWDVVVTNPDGRSGRLPGGFTITQASYLAVSADAVASLSSSRADE
ncbi:MAG: kelch repeat-containing protein, partial [Bryobacteraceae bacterium]|nr:kelch repeat-containing protein [Bryobacteraceae bacterium]